MTVSGAVTYIWHGDLARGCAAAGLCGVRGSLIVDPQRDTVFDPIQGAGQISLSPASAVVRVRREDRAASPGVCVDLLPLADLNLVVQHPRGGALGGALEGAALPSSGRCAGPTAADLAALALSVRRLPTRLPGFDASGRRTFAAGAFSGELISTLVIHPGGSSSGEASSGGSSGPSARPRKVLREQVDIDYRVASITGALRTTFAGLPAPLCEQFDACAARGTLSYAPIGASGTVSVSASRVVKRRVSPATVLGDLHAGRLLVDAFARSSARSSLSAELTWASGGTCRDSPPARLAPLDAQAGARALVLELGAAGGQAFGADGLRSRCPGPSQTDVIGPGPLARGGIDMRQLGARSLALMLRNPGAFHAGGYAGSRSGLVTVVLRLVRVRARTLLSSA